MSNIKPDDLRRQAAEEEFFRLAALEIESEQNEEFLEAQSLPDPSPEVLQRMQANLQQTMRKTQKRKRRRTIFLNLKRFSACAAIVFCVLVSGTYFSVDAARSSINNFVLDLFDNYAIVRTDDSSSLSGKALPSDWQGPFYIAWIPTRFTCTRAEQTKSSWILIYTSNSKNSNLSVYVWDTYHTPNIDTESMQLVSESDIQNTPSKIYIDKEGQNCMLIWVKEGYIIEIGGTVSTEEIKKIAESFVF